MNDKSSIVVQYIIGKIIHKLDESQIWQDNLATKVESLTLSTEEHMNPMHQNMREVAHDLRDIMDMVYEIQDLITHKE